MRRVTLDQVDFKRHDIAKLLIANVAGGGDGTGRDGCCSRIVVAQVGLEGFGALELFWTQRAALGSERCGRLWTAGHFHDALLVLLNELAVGWQHFVVGESDAVFCEEDVAAQVENGR